MAPTVNVSGNSASSKLTDDAIEAITHQVIVVRFHCQVDDPQAIYHVTFPIREPHPIHLLAKSTSICGKRIVAIGDITCHVIHLIV